MTEAENKYSILGLPLAPKEQLLQYNLTADPVTPTPSSLLRLERPSLLRRSRPVSAGTHFTFVTPLPLSFPYDFPSESDRPAGQQEPEGLSEEERARRRMKEIEDALQAWEPKAESDGGIVNPPTMGLGKDCVREGQPSLRAYTNESRLGPRFSPVRLLSISRSALDDCLPHLDVGDAFEWISAHAGQPGNISSGSGQTPGAGSDLRVQARQELSDVLGGRTVAADLIPSPSDGEGNAAVGSKDSEGAPNESDAAVPDEIGSGVAARQGYAPWSLCYAGHQFGMFAGQLGDGRAISFLETINPKTGEKFELQIKGAGRTPYSRFADGLAVLRSSLREYLGSEAVAALNIPTSRALAVVSLPSVPVLRETIETAAVTTRLAPSWLRIGSFQIHSSRQDYESVRLLGEYVARTHLGWKNIGDASKKAVAVTVANGDAKSEAAENETVKGKERSASTGAGAVPEEHASGVGDKWAKRFVEEVAVRNAETIAAWQIYGFMHGVMNTDNIALLGHTIDYGPYAFMDIFDQGHICNHSDDAGRYSYRMQPSMGAWAVMKLYEALSPLIGFELAPASKGGVPANLLSSASKSQMDEWKALAEEKSDEVESLFMATLLREWKRLFRLRLGLVTEKEDDKFVLFDRLFNIMEDLDMGHTFRALAEWVPTQGDESNEVKVDEAFLDRLLPDELIPEYERGIKRDAWRDWLKTYGNRLLEEGRSAGELVSDRKKVNPNFILRQWILEEVIERTRKNDTDFLNLVLEMCVKPYEDYGEKREGKTDEQVAEEKRLLTLGSAVMRGFQCSCSS